MILSLTSTDMRFIKGKCNQYSGHNGDNDHILFGMTRMKASNIGEHLIAQQIY